MEYSRLCSEIESKYALQRSYNDLLPSYPISWYKYTDSYRLICGKSIEIIIFGHKLVLSRLNNGNLSDCIDENGNKYHIIECNRIIFVWWDNNNIDNIPLWQIPIVCNSNDSNTIIDPINNNNIGINNWIYHGSIIHDIECHISEIPENGADIAHLEYLHGSFVIPYIPFIRHFWTCEYEPKLNPNSHLAKIDIYQSITFFGYRIPYSTVHSDIIQIGPGIVQLLFPTIFGKILIQETIQPQYTNLQRSNNVIYSEPSVPRFIAKLLLKAVAIQFERDFPIWNYKRWLRKPQIIKQDGPLLKYRRWMKQFYNNNQNNNNNNSNNSNTSNINDDNQNVNNSTGFGGKCIRLATGEEIWLQNNKSQIQ